MGDSARPLPTRAYPSIEWPWARLMYGLGAMQNFRRAPANVRLGSLAEIDLPAKSHRSTRLHLTPCLEALIRVDESREDVRD